MNSTEHTELAYSYHAVCSIMDARGFSMDEIATFLKKEQNEKGYILSSKIPTK